ncbi:MAG: bifunctional endoribonuclease/protein kinase ire1, partial [Candelina submexicana]
MPHRPRRPGRMVSTAIVCLLVLVAAAQQQQQRQWDQSSQDRVLPDTLSHSDQASKPQVQQPPGAAQQHLHQKIKSVTSKDVSAIATLAPAELEAAVRAPPRRSSGKPAGVSSLLQARSLQDWEVDDFVLLATVDGTIHARDRKTGASRWHLEVDKPMVETTYYPRNKSFSGHHRPENDYLWIVEPSRDGNLYIYNPGPNAGLQKLDLTVKKLVEELSPWEGGDPAVIYTAEKKSTLYTVDARTGKILKWFSTGGSSFNDDSSCPRVNSLASPEDQECGLSGRLTLGRTEYTVRISHDSGDPICTLKYSEWGPNNRDSDLQNQYSSTMDKKYVYSRYNGQVMCFDHARTYEQRQLYTQKFSSPVARVFDVARPSGSEARNSPLIILPQPVGPSGTPAFGAMTGSIADKERIFINCTETGGWYALSENMYPMVTDDAQSAICYNQDWLNSSPAWERTSYAQRKRALVGVHSITKYDANKPKSPALSAPELPLTKDVPIEVAPNPSSLPSPPMVNNEHSHSYNKENYTLYTIVATLLVVIAYVSGRKTNWVFPTWGASEVKASLPKLEQLFSFSHHSSEVQQPWQRELASEAEINVPVAEARNDALSAQEAPTIPDQATKSVQFVDEPQETLNLPQETLDTPQSSPQPKKKPAHRGKRGGAGRKKAKKERSGDSVDIIMGEVKEIGRPPGLQPDVVEFNKTILNPVTDVSSTIQIGNLVVKNDKILGLGSQGTMVYEGSFEGRAVAVKRMVRGQYDIALQEVRLLQQSDDHPNVIRYFCQQETQDFSYIALELCPATLQDVVERPQDYVSLSQACKMDLPNVCYQITAGIKHLHSLKIVHRDLKPQNILVAKSKVPTSSPEVILPPRLLISDFGLCKKLDDNQSSFGATTAHAAGTSGWRAPELLVDDDSPNQPIPPPSNNSTTHESSGSTVIDTQTNRRATRAIDIFSAGNVFFYILTDGDHAFDDPHIPNKYMREANIVRGKYYLKQLESLGDYAHEAIDLIDRMLSRDPRERPDATTVMRHPLFWVPQKRLDFLCNVSDFFEFEVRDPPSPNLLTLERVAPYVIPHSDFLKPLGREFVDNLGKMRKYNGGKMLDLLRALRNKKNHYMDMPDSLKASV